MFRKSMIALATVASLGAASLGPAAAASPAHAQSSAGQPQSGIVLVHDSRGGRDGYRDHGRDRDRNRWVERDDRRGGIRKVCSIQKVRVVERTRYGKTVRIVPKKECHFVGPRWH